MILWPILAAQEAGAGQRRGDRRPEAPARRPAARRRRGRRSSRSRTGTGDAVAGRAPDIDAGAAGPRDQRRRAADHRRGDRGRSSTPTRRAARPPRWPRWSSTTPPATVASSATPTGGVERVVETKTRRRRDGRGAGDPRGQHRHLRVRRRRAARGAGRAELRQRAGRALPARRPAAAARRGQARSAAHPIDRPATHARRQRPRRARRRARGSPRCASTSATCSPA